MWTSAHLVLLENIAAEAALRRKIAPLASTARRRPSIRCDVRMATTARHKTSLIFQTALFVRPITSAETGSRRSVR